jgi:NADPH:quinone reductase-like Zn-dependent oxidoreductase
MKAMVVSDGTLQITEVDEPVPGSRDLLVRVRATAVNRADLSQRAGRYSQPATARPGPLIAGLESAGEVLDVGNEVSRFRPGDRVMGQCSGGFAEYVCIDERLALPVPESLDWLSAAATPVAFVSEHDAIFTNGELQHGQSVLIQAAGSAVGLAAIQVARFAGAGEVFGTVDGDEQARLARSLGASVVIDHTAEDFEAVIGDATNGRGVDLIVDHVGGPVLAGNMRSLALTGRLISVGRLGPTVGEMDLDLLALKRLRLVGVTFRTRTIDEYETCVRSAEADLLPALSDGRLRPVVDSVFPLAEAVRAQDRMVANQHLGKIVLSVADAL